jgi:hypothetical protein
VKIIRIEKCGWCPYLYYNKEFQPRGDFIIPLGCYRKGAIPLITDPSSIHPDCPLPDDGWGRKETYPRFEDLFKQTFQKKMNDSWDAKREIERQVTAKVDALVKGEMTAVVAKIADALIKVA